MRTPTSFAARAALLALLPLLGGGCAGGVRYPAMPRPDALPPASPLRSTTLGLTDAWLRYYLMRGQPDSAARLLSRPGLGAPRDALLRQLQLALVLQRAGRWAESNAAFDAAEQEAERREARRLTQAVGTMIVNDGVADYVPSAPERAMIPYYRMLNYLALGRREDAVVEARKAAAFAVRRADRSAGERPCAEGGGMLEYLAGLVFQTAGERNDALVSLRRAERTFTRCRAPGGAGLALPPRFGGDLARAATLAGVREVADSARARYGLAAAPAASRNAGELVLLVEQGWVAHRASRAVALPITRAEADSLDGVDGASRTEMVARLAERLASNLTQQALWGSSLDDRYQLADALGGAYVMRLTWPVYRLEACRARAARVVVLSVAGDSTAATLPALTQDLGVSQDLSAQVVRSFAAARPLLYARTAGRGITKFMLTHQLEEKARDKGGEALAFVAGRLANLTGNALERADTRSWSLLPDRLSVARFALPPGRYRVAVDLLGGVGDAPGARVDVGTVDVTAGGTVFRAARVWGPEMGDLPMDDAPPTRQATTAARR